MHLVFYPHFNGPRDHSCARGALGGVPKAPAFTLYPWLAEEAPEASLSPLFLHVSPSLSRSLPISLSPSLSLHLPLSLCTPQRVLSDRIKSVWAARPPLSTCVCVCGVSAALTQKCAHNHKVIKKLRPLMSHGNYDLTIATTPEALTEDDVTPPPGQEKPEKQQSNIIRAVSASQKIEHYVFFPLWLSVV